MRATTFRYLVALAAVEQLFMEHLDVSNAFCQADLDKFSIHVDAPRGYENICPHGKCLKLLRALYGTKQASYLWQQTLAKYLVSIGFTRLATDPCVFQRKQNGVTMIVGVYVDDLIILHNSRKVFDEFLAKFMRRFESKYLGALEWFLGVHVRRYADGKISMDQSKYIADLVEKFFPNAESTTIRRNIPYPPDLCRTLGLATDTLEIERMKELPYLEIVGSLLYLTTMTRPDLAYIVGLLCRFMSGPSMQCFEAAQSVLLYAAKTKHLAITYNKKFVVPSALWSERANIEDKSGLHAFCDSSWNSPKSTYGFAVFMGGGPICYCSRLSKVITDSVAYAEYSAVSVCTKDLSFIRNLCNEIGHVLQGPIVLGVDNNASISIADNVGVSKLTKHFDLAVHRIRDEVEMLRCKLKHVPTKDQTADIFTKALDPTTFVYHRDRLLQQLRPSPMLTKEANCLGRSSACNAFDGPGKGKTVVYGESWLCPGCATEEGDIDALVHAETCPRCNTTRAMARSFLGNATVEQKAEAREHDDAAAQSSEMPVVPSETELVGTSTMHTLATADGDQPPQALLLRAIQYDNEDYDPLDSTKYQDALEYLWGRRGLYEGKFHEKSVADDDKRILHAVKCPNLLLTFRDEKKREEQDAAKTGTRKRRR